MHEPNGLGRTQIAFLAIPGRLGMGYPNEATPTKGAATVEPVSDGSRRQPTAQERNRRCDSCADYQVLSGTKSSRANPQYLVVAGVKNQQAIVSE